MDGSTIPFSEWLPGEPDGNEDENCIVQARGEQSPGWGDRHCFDIKAFVCELPLPGKYDLNLWRGKMPASWGISVKMYISFSVKRCH